MEERQYKGSKAEKPWHCLLWGLEEAQPSKLSSSYATTTSEGSEAWTRWRCDFTTIMGYKIKAKYINIRSLGMVWAFFWHDLYVDKEPFAEFR